ncbi:T9SS type A sorting domain-containing protein [Marixanthomonas spongiae]|nr:T9SS type A sorting domain-containing protein [Marixanthomonas spongiae]
MKNILLFITLVLGVTQLYSQNDCSQDDGTFQYRAHLTLENVPIDFNKNDFLTFIIGLDNISNQDLNTLTDHVTSVSKTIPSLNPHKSITIVATTEIYSILDELNNSIEFQYCVIRDCTQNDGTYSYYSTLTNGPIANDFDKNDFIDYVTELDDISTDDLAIITEHITAVYKAFPSSQSDFLKRTVVIDATADLYSILESLNNAIEFHECIDDAIILGLNDSRSINFSIIHPNPTKNIFNISNLKHGTIKVMDSQGRMVRKFKAGDSYSVKDLPKGIYFVQIQSGNYKTVRQLIKN